MIRSASQQVSSVSESFQIPKLSSTAMWTVSWLELNRKIYASTHERRHLLDSQFDMVLPHEEALQHSVKAIKTLS